MSIRALTTPATRGVAVVLLAGLLLVGGATAPRPVPTVVESTRTSTAAAAQADSAAPRARVARLTPVPDSAGKRRALRVLTNGCPYTRRGLPKCGVLLGAAYGSNTDPTAWERSMQHPL